MNSEPLRCRACLSETEEMHELFEDFEADLSLAKIIENFLNVQINSDDGFSKAVCLECTQIILQFYNFSITFKKNYNRTNDFIIENFIIDTENEVTDNVIDTSNRNCKELFLDEKTVCASHQRSDDTCTSIEAKPQFICEICGYISSKKSYLTDHMDIHAAEAKYSCEFCPKIFRRRATLSRHRRLHIKPRQFICEKCGQKFNDSGTLKTHTLLIHLRTKEHECVICSQTFSLKSTLEKHIKRHEHKEGAAKEFSCEMCDVKYYDKSSLTRHYSIKHKN